MTIQDWLAAMRPKFPQLSATNFRPTSPVDEGYNCIAWAAEDTDRWWWPDPQMQSFWPSGVPREVTLEAFAQAYGLLGYEESSDPTVASDQQKIAIYASVQKRPTHAARQLPDGWWTSKLGPQIDIEHEIAALDGPEYGSVALILARPAR